jgi:RNA polymerase subunit RPABC4/transcription elongation factor Spt4
VSRLILLQIVAGVIGGIIAATKGRHILFWFLACFLFPLLILVISFLPSLKAASGEKRCPRCTQPLRPGEDLCRNCGGKRPIELVQCRTCGSFVPENSVCPDCSGKR